MLRPTSAVMGPDGDWVEVAATWFPSLKANAVELVVRALPPGVVGSLSGMVASHFSPED